MINYYIILLINKYIPNIRVINYDIKIVFFSKYVLDIALSGGCYGHITPVR